ncbi:hypothetical protein CYFUS_006805 [Cystobacter fuscus]|uniref:Uncharacterized protein n=1 Tax=Cystobacter fuscus TaxID=43 RepID=A0A250JCN5_9BACT|nr:hypothetical protein CYFUS_006805 [Cystobacter fuscus]
MVRLGTGKGVPGCEGDRDLESPAPGGGRLVLGPTSPFPRAGGHAGFLRGPFPGAERYRGAGFGFSGGETYGLQVMWKVASWASPWVSSVTDTSRAPVLVRASVSRPRKKFG